MNPRANKTADNKSRQNAAPNVASSLNGSKASVQLKDNRTTAVAQRGLQVLANKDSQARQLKPATTKPSELMARQNKLSSVVQRKYEEVEEGREVEEKTENKELQILIDAGIVVEVGEKVNRRVWSGNTYHKKGIFTRTDNIDKPKGVKYVVLAARQYRVVKEHTFFTAVRTELAQTITSNRGFVLDPDHGNKHEPLDSAGYNCKGFNYFAISPKGCDAYGRTMGKGNATVVEFKLPTGTLLEVDPELKQWGLRTMSRIERKQFALPEPEWVMGRKRAEAFSHHD